MLAAATVSSSSASPRPLRRRISVGVVAGLLLATFGIARDGALEARVSPGSVTQVQVTGQAGVPADAVAVSVNLAAVSPSGGGYLAAYPCGGATPSTSTVNYDTRSATSNSAIVKVGTGGKICVLSSAASEILVDVTGWFAAGSGYTSLDPVRFLDTRNVQRMNPGSTQEVQITGRSGIPGSAAAVAVNLAAVNPGAAGYLSAYPCGGAAPSTSTVNHDTRAATSNSAIVKIGTGGKICVYSSSATDVLVDVTGWFASGSGYTSLDPVRAVDTRLTQQRLAPSSTRDVQVTGVAGIPSSATAVSINLAAVGPSGAGYLAAYPCGGATPTTSTVNHDIDYATSNSAIVKIGTGGKICVFSRAASDVIVDITGWFAGSGYSAIDPSRLLDTRDMEPTNGPGPTVGAQFVETFDKNTGLDRFNHGVWHRDPYLVEMQTWEGDHDLNCGSPDTHRTIHRTNPDESFYVCKDHIMDSVGDASGYSIAWFSPTMSFPSVTAVSFDVNLTDLGDRKWWKVGVVSESKYNTTVPQGGPMCCNSAPGFLFADAGASGLPDVGNGLEGPDRLIATWGEDHPGFFGIGSVHNKSSVNPAPNDKATRFPVSLVDNKNGTVTFTVAGQSVTQAGSFPPCPCKVVFYDHNYTPNKSSVPRPPNPWTWHWDNIVVR